MNKNLFAFLLFLIFGTIIQATIVPHVPPIHSHVPRTYKVSLDDTP